MKIEGEEWSSLPVGVQAFVVFIFLFIIFMVGLFIFLALNNADNTKHRWNIDSKQYMEDHSPTKETDKYIDWK